MAQETKTWVFYFFQGEEGEDRSHPNAFSINHSKPLKLSDIKRHFPMPNVNHFHFRFRLDAPRQGTFFWIDITTDRDVPICNGRVIVKVLRLYQKKPRKLVLRPRKVIKAEQPNQSSVRRRQQESYQPPPPTTDTKSGSDRFRPAAKGSPRQAAPSPRARKEMPRRKDSAGAKPKPKPEPKPQPEESFEDFLSGGGAKAPENSSDDLMGSEWSSARRDPMDRFDPLSSPRSNGRSQAPATTSPPPRPQKTVPVKEKPQFQQGGQTVGPVTLKEMESVKQGTSDGSQVYNPKFVDKSTKSAAVRRAMEKREKEAAAKAAAAAQELRDREDNAKAVENAKQRAKEVIGPRLKTWSEDNGRKKNIRTLISTMHQVVWEGCNWKEVGMAKLLQPNGVKKAYRRAMLVVHPDKNSGRTPDQIFIAQSIFDALNSAWEEFEKMEMS